MLTFLLEFFTHPYTLAVFAALLPVVLLMAYITYHDRKQPEPLKWLLKGVVYGVCSALIVILFVGPLPSVCYMFGLDETTPLGQIATAFGQAAIPEECAKLLMLWLLLRHNPYFDERFDGIVYAVCVGLGFAGLENILYVFSNLDELATIGISRAIFAVPGHFFFAVAMGYFYSRAHFDMGRSKKVICYAAALLVPILIHGVYDAILMVKTVADEVSGFLVIVFLVFCYYVQRYGRRRIHELKNR